MSKLVRFISQLLLALIIMLPTPVSANADFSYGGWLSDGGGNALTGTINIEVEYYDAVTGGSLLHGPDTHSSVTLNEGVFQIDISLSDADAQTIFSNTSVFIQIKDVTNGTTHPRARFSVVPYALKIPVDGSSLTFDVRILRLSATPPYKKKGQHFAGIWYFKIAKN
jgi:hypothetical protein